MNAQVSQFNIQILRLQQQMLAQRPMSSHRWDAYQQMIRGLAARRDALKESENNCLLAARSAIESQSTERRKSMRDADEMMDRMLARSPADVLARAIDHLFEASPTPLLELADMDAVAALESAQVEAQCAEETP